jgi:hypothetical protein
MSMLYFAEIDISLSMVGSSAGGKLNSLATRPFRRYEMPTTGERIRPVAR